MQWYKYFYEVKDEMFHSTRRSRLEKYISSFTEFVPFHKWETFIICSIYIVQKFKFLNKFKRKSIIERFLAQAKQAKTFYKLRVQLYEDVCVTLNARTAPIAFPRVEFRT